MKKLLVLSFVLLFASINAQNFNNSAGTAKPEDPKYGFFSSKASALDNPTNPPVDDDPAEPLPIGNASYVLLIGAVALAAIYYKRTDKITQA